MQEHNKNKAFDKETLEQCKTQWIVPKENTMLVFEQEPSIVTENSLIFEKRKWQFESRLFDLKIKI